VSFDYNGASPPTDHRCRAHERWCMMVIELLAVAALIAIAIPVIANF
jgi:hypothetical protein